MFNCVVGRVEKSRIPLSDMKIGQLAIIVESPKESHFHKHIVLKVTNSYVVSLSSCCRMGLDNSDGKNYVVELLPAGSSVTLNVIEE